MPARFMDARLAPARRSGRAETLALPCRGFDGAAARRGAEDTLSDERPPFRAPERMPADAVFGFAARAVFGVRGELDAFAFGRDEPFARRYVGLAVREAEEFDFRLELNAIPFS